MFDELGLDQLVQTPVAGTDNHQIAKVAGSGASIEHGIAAGHVRRDDVQLDVELVFDDLGEPAALLQTLAAGQRVEDLDGHFGTVVLGVGTVAAAAAGRERQQRSSRNASRNRAGGDFLQFYAETSLYSFF